MMNYSPLIGCIYIFNLIVGTGTLALPASFQHAGWVLGSLIMACIASVGFITVTFTIEAMSISNALTVVSSQKEIFDEQTQDVDSGQNQDILKNKEDEPLLSTSQENSPFEILKCLEMGDMVKLYFNGFGVKIFYFCIIVYLYGDLSIYAIVVPLSLRNITCSYHAANQTLDFLPTSDYGPCWEYSLISRIQAYHIYLAIFSITLCSFVFFDITKTKFLQFTTTLIRWTAFIMMISISIHRIIIGAGPKDKPIMANDVYSLNFFPQVDASEAEATNSKFLQYFISLFPVFVLSSNFPIIGITLRNNLQSMLACPVNPVARRIVFPLLAIIPPIVIAAATQNIQVLVGVTGAYAGSAIQYVVPAALVLLARRQLSLINAQQRHRSYFSHPCWVYIIFAWSILGFCLVTADFVINGL